MNHSKIPLGVLIDEAFPSSSPSMQLEARILSRIGARVPRRPRRLAFAAAGGAFALIGAIVLAPRALAYAEFRRIEAAADALPEWHLTCSTPDITGQLVKSGETWCRNGQVREEREYGKLELLWSGNSVIEYRQGEDHAVRSLGSDASTQIKKLSGFIQELQRSTSLMGLSVERDVAVDGRQATRVSAMSKNEPVRISIYADSSTDVPFLGLVEVRSEHGWRVERRVTIDATPLAVSGSTFSLPAGVRVVDRSALQQEWQLKLGKPIATYAGTDKSTTVEIRDVWVNRDGLVLVIYTNKRSFRPVDTKGWKSVTGPNGEKMLVSPHSAPFSSLKNNPELVAVEDDLGAEYAKLDCFQGYETSTDGNWSKGLTWPEGDAQVAVYAPVMPQSRAAHRIKLQFGFTDYVVPKGFKPHGKWVSMSEMEPRHTTSATHIQVVTPHPLQLPEWADYIGMCPKPLELDAEVARVRGKAAIARGDGQVAEADARDYLRLTQMEAAQSGMSYVMSSRYDLLGQALATEGKSEEARQAWRQALDDAQGPDNDRISKEIATLTVIPR